jgi:hypothetical protein
MNETAPSLLSGRIATVLLSSLGIDVIELLAIVFRFIQRVFPIAAQPGIYEVLEREIRLELKDPHGKEAIFHKRQRVRFLQDNIIAYEDKAWGDGKIFEDYKCSPGVPVDSYRDGYRWRILISLRKTENRGDVEEFNIQRTIKNGFRQKREDLQSDIDHRTHKMSLSVVFPPQRLPKHAWLIEQKRNRTTELGRENFHILPDGREQVTWTTDKPKLHEAYILRWEW